MAVRQASRERQNVVLPFLELRPLDIGLLLWRDRQLARADAAELLGMLTPKLALYQGRVWPRKFQKPPLVFRLCMTWSRPRTDSSGEVVPWWSVMSVAT
jgi:hypothetical protein